MSQIVRNQGKKEQYVQFIKDNFMSMTDEQMAEQLKIQPSYVKTLRGENHLARTKAHHSHAAAYDNKNRILYMYRHDQSIKAIAEEFDITTQSVVRLLNSEGIKTRGNRKDINI